MAILRYSARKFAKGKVGSTRAITFSERSGTPIYYDEMVREPGTGLRVHRDESDGYYNRKDQPRDPIIEPDAQTIKDGVAGPQQDRTFSFYLIDITTQEPLYVDLVQSGTLNVE